MDKIEKEKLEEKRQERDLQTKIRDLKIKKSKSRRENPGNFALPATKKRKTGQETHKRILQVETVQEKRKEDEQYHSLFKTKAVKARKVEEIEEEKENPLDKYYEGGRKKTDEELQQEWQERLKEREERIAREEYERNKLKSTAERIEKGWLLMKLCREMIELNGEKWKKSKETRDRERREDLERQERLQVAGNKRKKTLHKLALKNIQTKITETLDKLPENRRKRIEMEEKKEKTLMMKEAKQAMWKKWQQKKGKKTKSWKDLDDKESPEQKLERIEKEVERYQIEIAREKEEKEKKVKKIQKKKDKEQHWAMMKWVVKFMEENKEAWNKKRAEEQAEKEFEETAEEW